MSFNRETRIFADDGLYRCKYKVGGGGGEGTLAPLAPYGFSETVGIIIDKNNEKVFARLVKRGEIAVDFIRKWNK